MPYDLEGSTIGTAPDLEEQPDVIPLEGEGPAKQGQLKPGNLDPYNRPILKNPDGSISTTSSISIGTDAGEVVIPTVVNGVRLSNEDAIKHYRQTGENFGTFKDAASADAFAEDLHNKQAAKLGFGPGQAEEIPFAYQDPKTGEWADITPSEAKARGIPVPETLGEAQGAPAPSAPQSQYDLEGSRIEALPRGGMESWRADIVSELDRNPKTKLLAMQMLDTEGGGVATMEALVNRTAMIRQKIPDWTLNDELNSGFYGPINRGYAQTRELSPKAMAQYQNDIDAVRAGSNVIQGRTDQGYRGDPNWRGPGRVHVPGSPNEIYNFWTGKRGGVSFSHADAAEFAENVASGALPKGVTPLVTPGGGFILEGSTIGPPNPFVEFGARVVRGAESSLRDVSAAQFTGLEQLTRGARSPYVEHPEEAADDISDLAYRLSIAKDNLKQQAQREDPNASLYTNFGVLDSPEIERLEKQLGEARKAVQGENFEAPLGRFSRLMETMSEEAVQNQQAAMKKYEPWITEAKNSDWGMQLADGLGHTLPGFLSTVGNPVLGLGVMYAGIYQQAATSYMQQKPDATREEAQKYATEMALLQTPWLLAGNMMTARAIKSSFAALPADAMQNGAERFGHFLGEAIQKNARALVGNVIVAIPGQHLTQAIVDEDWELRPPTTPKQKFDELPRAMSQAAATQLILSGAGVTAAGIARRGEFKSFSDLPPAGEILLKPTAKAKPPEEKPPEEKPPTPDEEFAPKAEEPAKPAEPKALPALKEEPIKPPEKPAEEEPAKGIPAAPKGVGYLDLDKPAIDHDFGNEWRMLVQEGYDEVRTPRSYITEFSGNDLLRHLMKTRSRDEAMDYLKKKFGIDGLTFKHDGNTYKVNFTTPAPGPKTPAGKALATVLPPGGPPTGIPPRGPPPTGAPPPGLPPSTSIVPVPPPPLRPGPRSVIRPLFQNPFGRGRFPYLRFPINDLFRFFQGTAKIFEKSPGFEGLGKAIRDWKDYRDAFYGWSTNPFREWEQGWRETTTPTRSVRVRDKMTSVQKSQAISEFETFMLQQDDYDPAVRARAPNTYETISDRGRELIDLWRQYAKETGMINQANGVRVLNPATGKWKPIGNLGSSDVPGTVPTEPIYFPRMINRKYLDAMRSPHEFPELYNEIIDEMTAKGFNPAEIRKYISDFMSRVKSNDYFAALDMARTAKFPTKMFSYDFESARRYMSAWSNRMAQIKAFGQKTDMTPNDLFDNYQHLAGDEVTRSYIGYVRDRMYNIHTADPIADTIRGVMTGLVGLQLGNPETAQRNLLSGQAMIAAKYGIKNYVSSLLNIKKLFEAIPDDHEKGIIKDDLMNLVELGTKIGGPDIITRGTTGLLKISGELGAEKFNRLVNTVAAKSMLRTTIRSYDDAPLSRKTRMLFGDIKRLGGVDPQALIDERGSGPLTDRYLRQSVNKIQGGYSLDQTPAFMNTETGRFFFMYSKWGTQQLDFFHSEILRPAERALTLGKLGAEEVKIRVPPALPAPGVSVPTPPGTTVTAKVPGSLVPVLRYLAVLSVGGAASEAISRYGFGTEPKGESWTEIMHKLDNDSVAGLLATAYKLWQYQLTMGVGGILGNYAQMGIDFTERVRFKDPTTPIPVSFVRETTDLFTRFANRQEVEWRDVEAYLRRNVSLFRTTEQLAAYWGNDVVPLGVRVLERESMRQDLVQLGRATKRFEKAVEIGTRQPYPGGGEVGPSTGFVQDVKDALLMGDAAEARRLIRARFIGMPQDKRDVAMESLVQSVRNSRPIKVGTSRSEASAKLFIRWATENMSPADVAKFQRIDNTYMRTAKAANLLDVQTLDKEGLPRLPKGLTEEDLKEALQTMQIREEMRQTPGP
jgi:hypothetical protein